MKQVVMIVGMFSYLCAMEQESSALYNRQTFETVQTLRSMVHGWLKGSLKNGSVSFHMAHTDLAIHHHLRQTQQGIIIEWALCEENKNKKVPRELWTPWGQVPLVGAISGDCSSLVKLIENTFILKKYEGQVMPYLPGIYESVLASQTSIVPSAELLHYKGQRSIAQVQAAWKILDTSAPQAT